METKVYNLKICMADVPKDFISRFSLKAAVTCNSPVGYMFEVYEDLSLYNVQDPEFLELVSEAFIRGYNYIVFPY